MIKKIARTLSTGLLVATLLTIPSLAASKPIASIDKVAQSLTACSSTSLMSEMLIPGGSFFFIEDITGSISDTFISGESTAPQTTAVDSRATSPEATLLQEVLPSELKNPLPRAYAGSTLTVIGTAGSWLKVETEDGKIGFVDGNHVATSRLIYAVIPETTGAKVVREAKELLGAPYVWGGTTPDGFDCSGFVNYVYGLFGYTMSRSAQSIFNDDGIEVGKDDLQAGDVLFFGSSNSRIGHTAIYIADGKFIHASDYGIGVIISDLYDGWYEAKLVGVKRIIEDTSLEA